MYNTKVLFAKIPGTMALVAPAIYKPYQQIFGRMALVAQAINQPYSSHIWNNGSS